MSATIPTLYPNLDSMQDPPPPEKTMQEVKASRASDNLIVVVNNKNKNNKNENNDNDDDTEDSEPKEVNRLPSPLRFGKWGLALLAVIGLCVFVSFFVLAFYVKDKVYEFSCPMSAMWMGLAVLWFSVLLLVWWALSKTKSKMMLQVWLFVSVIFALEGFLSLVCYAAARNEGAASGLGFMWIVAGAIGAAMCVAQKRESAYSSDALVPLDASDKDSRSSACYGRCCSAQFWLNFFEIFLLLWLFLFSTGIVVQAGFTASDGHVFSPPGAIYTINANGAALRMHLYCFGGNGGANTTTVLFEHGGGSNSITMLALAETMVDSYGTRACIYDRLGYGFSPSYYTGAQALPTSGELLSALLDQAEEAGPFVCAGHSAGAEACLWFAQARSVRGDVRGVAMMDGYPDLIRSGAFRPGLEPTASILGTIQGMAVAAGATGLSRGSVGNPGGDFVPQDERATVVALYGQNRFWFSQYWDVKTDFATPDEERLYRVLKGQKDDDGLVHYGGALRGVKVLVLPADRTTNNTYTRTCEDPDKDSSGEFCCGHARNSSICNNQFADSVKYREQALLYAQTLSDVQGTVIFGPKGSDHAFVYHKEHYKWVAEQLATELLG